MTPLEAGYFMIPVSAPEMFPNFERKHAPASLRAGEFAFLTNEKAPLSC